MHAADKTRPSAIGADFEAPIDQRYFEDYRVGTVYHYGAIMPRSGLERGRFASRTVTRILNQNDELVMSCKAINLLRRRDSA